MNSLINIIDTINESEFYATPLAKKQKIFLSNFIAERQGLPGSYGSLFAPFPADDMKSYRLFTGEKPSRLSALHIIGEESCRALLTLGVNNTQSKKALLNAANPILETYRKKRKPTVNFPQPFFCCPKCTCGLWRHLSARTDEHSEKDLEEGMKALKDWRNGEGGWKMFPQYYTLLVLTEMDSRKAKSELQYAAKACEKELSMPKRVTGKYSQRRIDVLKRVLSLV